MSARSLTRGVAGALAAFVCACGATPAAGEFVPGHAYTPIDGGWIIEWNENLEEVRRFQVHDVNSVTGATFNDRGNLVFIAWMLGDVKVLEVDATGEILREYDTGHGALCAGSYIDYDPSREIYAFADRFCVTVLDNDLTYQDSTTYEFERPSGVAFAPNGHVYATDQLDARLIEFDEGLGFLESFNAHWVPTGIDITDDYQLLLASYGEGELRRFDLETHEWTTVVSDLGYGNINDVVVLPDRRLLVADDNANLTLYTWTGEFITGANEYPGNGDSVAYFVPAPGGLSTILLAGLIGGRRRRREGDRVG